MGVPLKTENEEYAEKTMQIKGSEGGRRDFTRTSMEGFRWQVPRKPSARLTHSLKLVTGVWLLRCSVLRGTPMASAIHFKKLPCYEKWLLLASAKGIGLRFRPLREAFALPCLPFEAPKGTAFRTKGGGGRQNDGYPIS
jgi:hypothetical protein